MGFFCALIVIYNMSKLFIYGCSHSSNHRVSMNEFWGQLLSNQLKLDKLVVRSAPGRGVGHILSLLFEDIYNREIQVGDVVIWNTSYPARFSHPYLNRDIAVGQFGQDSLDRAEYRIKDVDGKTKRLWSHDMDMINHWFQQTVVGYDIIKGLGVEVYQWCLFGVEELEELLNVVTLRNKNEITYENEKGLCYLNPTIDTRPIIKWENLIQPPSEYKDWMEFIEYHMLGLDGETNTFDAHMNVRGHKRFSQELYKTIKEIRN